MNELSQLQVGRGQTGGIAERRRQNRRRMRSVAGGAQARLEPLEARQLLSTYVVDTFDDVVDSRDTFTSLREAITLAAKGRGDDLVQLPAGTYRLSKGELSIKGSSGKITIQGVGGQATIDAQGASRVLRIQDSSVELNGLTITGGNTGPRTRKEPGTGGGIYSDTSTLVLTNSAVSGNTASWGGGGILSVNASTMTLMGSIVSGNSAEFAAGIWNSRASSATLIDSSVSGNTAVEWRDAGGIESSGGKLTLTRSTVSRNTGIGIQSVDSTTTLTDSIVSGNTMHGLFAMRISTAVPSRTVVTGSTITGNAGGGIYLGTTTLTLTNSTVAGNHGYDGGGIFLEDSWDWDSHPLLSSALTVINSTISGNTTRSGWGTGGGIYVGYRNTATLINSTVVGNTAENSGGGIDFGWNSTVSLANTIISGNTAAGLGPDVYGSTASSGHNLIGDPSGSSGWLESDLLGVDPLLGPLADNGGPTLTHALLPGSPAIDAGDDALAVDPDGNPLTTDQRGAGYPRILGTAVDIGAYEYAAEPLVMLAGALIDTQPTCLSVSFSTSAIAVDADADEDEHEADLLPAGRSLRQLID